MRLRIYLNRIATILDSRTEIEQEFLRVEETSPGREGIIEGRLRFWDGSLLAFVEVLVAQGVVLTKVNYAYHYQNAADGLIFRYDNAPHHPEAATFPHHKHTPLGVEEAEPPAFGDILREIDQYLYVADNDV